MKPEGIDVKLGEHEYRVRPQRHAYLKREIRKFFTSLQELGDTSAENLLDVFTERTYALLKVFIPDLMPEWEFEGFASDDAMKRDAYNEDDDQSPDAPQIKNALAVAIQVNDLDWVGQLKNFIGTDLLRQQVRAAMAQWAMQQQALTTPSQQTRTSSTPQPASLPHENGGSAPESSGTADPTPATPQTTS